MIIDFKTKAITQFVSSLIFITDHLLDTINCEEKDKDYERCYLRGKKDAYTIILKALQSNPVAHLTATEFYKVIVDA